MDRDHFTRSCERLWPVVATLAGTPLPPQSADEKRRFAHEAMQQFLLPLLVGDGAQEVLPEFRVFERANRARTDILCKEMNAFVVRMDGEPFAVLKGWDYAFRLYGDAHLRPMSDLDVFVPSDRIAAIDARLEAAGMRRIRQGGHRSRDAHYEHVFVSDKAMIEVHQGFTHRPRHAVDYDGIWSRRVLVDGNVFRLSDADAIAYHTLSMGIDEFSVRLIRYLDLRLMIEANPAALAEAAELARRWRSRRMFYGALRTTAMIFPDLPDDDYLRLMTTILPASTRARLDRYVLPDPRLERGAAHSRLRQLWRKFWLIDTASRRFRFLGHYARVQLASRGAGFRLAP